MSVAVNNNVENHDEHHHKETFITKWIFSQDHKMIAKQYFITGVTVSYTHLTLPTNREV